MSPPHKWERDRIRDLAKELGKKGIRVNGVCPVAIPTKGLVHALQSDYAPGQKNPIGWMQSISQTQSALQRLPTGKDVANMCYFLASDAAESITGQNINVDCGVFPQ
jgi:3-oxoacyl-[acyl-carrier protein] reductase/meso-butanediol dehydrogenase/(S,S)-butanediol dehydrogenase/diacetyl reductase